MKNEMEATLRAGVLKCLLECTKDLWTSANIVFRDDGMHLQAMDSSHVALASLTLTPAAFSLFCCPKQATLGINFDSLSTVLRNCATEDQIKFEFVVDSDHITILRGEERQWELKLLEIEEERASIPDQSYDVSASIPSFGFQKCMRDLKDLGGETVTISVSESGVACSVDGHIGRGTASMKDGVNIDGEMDSRCSYPLKYLSAFAKGSSLCPMVRMRMGKETPMCLTHDVQGHGSLEFYLAPRIEDD